MLIGGYLAAWGEAALHNPVDPRLRFRPRRWGCNVPRCVQGESELGRDSLQCSVGGDVLVLVRPLSVPKLHAAEIRLQLWAENDFTEPARLIGEVLLGCLGASDPPLVLAGEPLLDSAGQPVGISVSCT